jgi:hypothetical protein
VVRIKTFTDTYVQLGPIFTERIDWYDGFGKIVTIKPSCLLGRFLYGSAAIRRFGEFILGDLLNVMYANRLFFFFLAIRRFERFFVGSNS